MSRLTDYMPVPMTLGDAKFKEGQYKIRNRPLERAVLEWFKGLGPRGAMAWQAQERFRGHPLVREPSAVTKAVSKLKTAGLLVETGRKGKTNIGRQADILMAACYA